MTRLVFSLSRVFLILSCFILLSVSIASDIPWFGNVKLPGVGLCEAANASEYVIGIDDVVAVTVRDREDLSGMFLVGPSGTITIPLLGEVKAMGLTPSQLSRELSRKLSVFRAGDAVVTIAEYNSQKVFVVGEVVSPGKYSFPVIPSIWNVLSEAGGPTEDAFLSAVQVIRAGSGETLTVDVRRILSGEASEQVRLFPGDTIRVLRKTVSAPEGYVVYVLGEVNTQGSYEVAFARDLVAAISAAGGPTDRAELRKISIVRKTGSSSATIQVNLEKYLKKGLVSSNPELRPGDTVTVPRRWSLLGSLASPAVLAALLSATASVVVITTAD